ncbi:uncharacterized protein LOC117943817 isoform X2 [Etheostoma cragini]|uniref:uncharacterized protein LOC117943817 isoform X2 n=1 Tax=Etheostoma cragini TaxID=417921 RepID=UPI00155EF650|nr:uncharacterized protein LOC117943817 isoform X2 [Etheostoma cragini]
MKSVLLYVPMAMVVMSTLVGLTATTPWFRTTTPTWTTTAGASGLNLNGKMFTLSVNGGGVSFYSPYFSPTTSSPYTTRRPYYTTTRPYTPQPTTRRPYYTTTRPYTPRTTTPRPTTTRPWTTAPTTRGVSVCLRYMSDFQTDIRSIFTLSPSSRQPLQMGVSASGSYRLSFDRYGYYNLNLKPYKTFWANIRLEIWTRVCLTVDTMKNVAQLFSDSSMSIRKMLPTDYVWSGEPVIDFSGFDGQVTDVQIWDYSLKYREVLNYMNSGRYSSYSGSALTWSYISYSLRGKVLLEDVYERQWQDQQLIQSKKKNMRQPKGEKKSREFFNLSESKREQL